MKELWATQLNPFEYKNVFIDFFFQRHSKQNEAKGHSREKDDASYNILTNIHTYSPERKEVTNLHILYLTTAVWG